MTPDQKFKTAYRAALKAYGSDSAIPAEERRMLGERLRADYIVERYGLDAAALTQHSIASRVIEELCGEAPVIERRQKIADRRRVVDAWVRDNAGVTVTPQTIAEVGGFSYSTAMSYINERVDAFTKVKRGFYAVRDVEAERNADRNRS